MSSQKKKKTNVKTKNVKNIPKKTTPKKTNPPKTKKTKVTKNNTQKKKEVELKLKHYKKKGKAITLIIFILLFIILLLILQDYNRKPEIVKIDYSKEYNEDKSKDVYLEIKQFNLNNVYCKFETEGNSSDWILVEDGICSYNVNTKPYKVTLKYNGNLKVVYDEDFDVDGIIKFELSDTRKYLPVGESFQINSVLEYVGEKYKNITYKSSDDNIVRVNSEGVVEAVNDGIATISVTAGDTITKEFELISSSLIRSPSINNSRELMPCNSFTEEQIALVDKILETKINDAGVGTRAAATEAARFITLELKYKVPYFYENGRLTYSFQVDGEGRYYHKGLYLGEAKEKEITLTRSGPASWGCPLQDADSLLWGRNGLDCSGYVTWVLVNAGLDLGDIGAGITGSRDYTDVGEFQRVTYSLLTSGKVKPGDLIGWDGHIAIIAAMDENNIYVTESLENGVIIDEYNYSSPYSRFYGRYQHIIDMSGNYYNGDGNLKNMW